MPQHMFLLLIYVVAMTNQKKIIKISNGNECIGSGHPVGGVAPGRGCLRWQTDRKEGTSLYYTYNIKYLHLFGLLPCFLLASFVGGLQSA